jgi:hypothetical protein
MENNPGRRSNRQLEHVANMPPNRLTLAIIIRRNNYITHAQFDFAFNTGNLF